MNAFCDISDYEKIDNDPEYTYINEVTESFKQPEPNITIPIQQPRIQRARPNRYVKTHSGAPFIVPANTVPSGGNEGSTDDKPVKTNTSEAGVPAIYDYTITRVETDQIQKKVLSHRRRIVLYIAAAATLLVLVVGASVFAAKMFTEKSGQAGKEKYYL